MNTFFIIAIVLAGLTIASWIIAWWKDSPPMAIVGVTCAIVAIFLGAGGAQVNQDKYNEESVRICDAKHGTVSKDNHCMVNNKPVEFAPGVWQRNW